MADKKGEKGSAGKTKKPNIFAVLKPYRPMIFSLIGFALLSNAANLVVPKIISHGIDDFSKGIFSYRDIVIEFLVAALIVFLFSFLQGLLQTCLLYTSPSPRD